MPTPTQIVQERRDGLKELLNGWLKYLKEVGYVNAPSEKQVLGHNLTTAIEILKAVKEMVGEEKEYTETEDEMGIRRFNNMVGENQVIRRLHSLIDTEIANIIKLQ